MKEKVARSMCRCFGEPLACPNGEICELKMIQADWALDALMDPCAAVIGTLLAAMNDEHADCDTALGVWRSIISDMKGGT